MLIIAATIIQVSKTELHNYRGNSEIQEFILDQQPVWNEMVEICRELHRFLLAQAYNCFY